MLNRLIIVKLNVVIILCYGLCKPPIIDIQLSMGMGPAYLMPSLIGWTHNQNDFKRTPNCIHGVLSTSFQVMVCLLFHGNPLPESILTYNQFS